MEYPELVSACRPRRDHARDRPPVVVRRGRHRPVRRVLARRELRLVFARPPPPSLDPLQAQAAVRPGAGARRGIPLDSSIELFVRVSPFAVIEFLYLAGSARYTGSNATSGARAMTSFLRLLHARHRHAVMRKSDVLAAIAEVTPASTWIAGSRCALAPCYARWHARGRHDLRRRAADPRRARRTGDRLDRDAAPALRARPLARAPGRARRARRRLEGQAPVHPLRGRPHAPLAPAHERLVGRVRARAALGQVAEPRLARDPHGAATRSCSSAGRCSS